jgi:hypothetical protein
VIGLIKKKVIDIETHSFFRMMERGVKYGLSYEETKKRAYNAVRKGTQAKRKHASKQGPTYYYYFQDNLSFYVICKEKEFVDYIKSVIRTVIIEEGRE